MFYHQVACKVLRLFLKRRGRDGRRRRRRRSGFHNRTVAIVASDGLLLF
jgi:hypothetical protein